MTAQSSLVVLYTTEDANAPMAASAVGPVGGSQPHENMQPYLAVSYIISLFGIFPSPDVKRAHHVVPFVAEIRIFACNFAPKGWAQCNGQLLPLSQNTALFSLLGTFYGGDGKSTFALPDLQGSVALHQGQGAGLSDYFLGQQSGSEFVTLLQSEIPLHTHRLSASNILAELQAPNTDRNPRSLVRNQRLPDQQHPEPGQYGLPGVGACRRKPSSQQHDAVSGAQLLHRAAGCLPGTAVAPFIETRIRP